MIVSNTLLFFAQCCLLFLCSLTALHISSYALVSLIIIQSVLANLHVLETISFFGLTATAAEPFTVGTIVAMHLLQEYHGRLLARHTLYLSIAANILYALVGVIHLQYMPVMPDVFFHYEAIFSIAPRIVFASITAYAIAGRVDIFLFALLKRAFKGQYLTIRNVIAAVISQIVDTAVFGFIGLYGVLPNLLSVMFVSYCVKMIGILLGAPFVRLSKLLMQKNGAQKDP